MNLLLVADAFPPMRTSAAVHMEDLALELSVQGHEITVLVPSQEIPQSIDIVSTNAYQLIRVKGFKTKGVGYMRRLIAEITNPLLMLFRIKKSNILQKKIDGIIWYSPSIFFSPLISHLAYQFHCPSYLISRDLFPRWTLDLGVLKEGALYKFLKWRELSQYKVADVIGIQAPGNAVFFNEFSKKIQSKIEVLWTWTSTISQSQCSIDVTKTKLAGRKIFLYSGNMGVAQNMRPILELALLLKDRMDIGFLMVGRGDEMLTLKQIAANHNLKNILFKDEIDSSEIQSLCAQCHVGIVSLDLRHKTHNIPGKFLTYMNSGLPVLAKLNPGNDLMGLISEYGVGVSVASEDPVLLGAAVDEILLKLSSDKDVSMRCKGLADDLFSTARAAKQITEALQLKNM